MKVHKVILALGILALGGIAAFAVDPWASQVTTAAVQMMPAVKSIDFAVMDVPIDTTPRGLFIVVQ